MQASTQGSCRPCDVMNAASYTCSQSGQMWAHACGMCSRLWTRGGCLGPCPAWTRWCLRSNKGTWWRSWSRWRPAAGGVWEGRFEPGGSLPAAAGGRKNHAWVAWGDMRLAFHVAATAFISRPRVRCSGDTKIDFQRFAAGLAGGVGAEECAVCLESLQGTGTGGALGFPCGHLFHKVGCCTRCCRQAV